jgi:hypothetical protein
MIEIRRSTHEATCAICGRTLLTGERSVSYRRHGEDDALVCELCLESADARGWVREGAPVLPVRLEARRERGVRGWLSDPRVSVVRRSHREVVVTVAWDLSWYQYRVDMLGAQPVTLQRRGDDLEEIDDRFCEWNAAAEPDGTLELVS